MCLLTHTRTHTQHTPLHTTHATLSLPQGALLGGGEAFTSLLSTYALTLLGVRHRDCRFLERGYDERARRAAKAGRRAALPPPSRWWWIPDQLLLSYLVYSSELGEFAYTDAAWGDGDTAADETNRSTSEYTAEATRRRGQLVMRGGRGGRAEPHHWPPLLLQRNEDGLVYHLGANTRLGEGEGEPASSVEDSSRLGSRHGPRQHGHAGQRPPSHRRPARPPSPLTSSLPPHRFGFGVRNPAGTALAAMVHQYDRAPPLAAAIADYFRAAAPPEPQQPRRKQAKPRSPPQPRPKPAGPQPIGAGGAAADAARRRRPAPMRAVRVT